MEWIISAAHWLTEFVKSLGYLGVFIMTFVESTFIPIPAEITMVPAGYLVQQGHMHGWWVMVSAVAGALGGSLLNYWIALRYGRKMFEQHSRLFLMKPEKLQKIEAFFEEHGAISTFTGRLLPGVRHYISFPAGLAKMKLHLFCLYTSVGGALWMGILFALGYFIGENELIVKKYLFYIVCGLVVGSAVLVWGYLAYNRKRKLQNSKP